MPSIANAARPTGPPEKTLVKCGIKKASPTRILPAGKRKGLDFIGMGPARKLDRLNRRLLVREKFVKFGGAINWMQTILSAGPYSGPSA
jgi:hypothetical protein